MEIRVIGAVEDYLESFAQVIVDIDVAERLSRPENLEVSLRYVLKHAKLKGAAIFSSFRHIREAEPVCGTQKTMAGKPGKRRCAAGEWAKKVVRPWVSRSQGKSSAVPRQHPADSPASAKLVVG